MKTNNIRFNNNNTKHADSEVIDASKKRNSVFDKIFRTNKDVDTDNDGTISFDEAIEYIKKNYTKENVKEIIFKIAAFLGVEKKNNGYGIDKDNSFYNEIIENIEILKIVDKNNDNNVDLQEAKSANNLNEKETIKLNRILGIIDNKFNNKQGTFGTCYLLTSGDGIARNAPKVFKQIVKQHENGDITVTFYGTEEEPFSCKIPNKRIQREQEARAKRRNDIITYGKKSQYGSSDPDAIALEVAISLYAKSIKDKNKQQEEEIQNYIDNSVFKIVEKPSIEALTYQELTQEKLDELHNYYMNSVNNSGERGCDIYAFTKNRNHLTQEQFDWFINEYFPNSKPTILEKPKKLSNSSAVKNWIKNSHSDTFTKPEIKPKKGYPNLNNGWFTRDTIRLLAGGTWKNYNINVTDESIIKEELANLMKKSSISNETTVDIATTGFLKPDLNGKIKPKHAYLINYTTKTHVILTDPHDSTQIISYPIKDFLKNYHDFSINTIPREISE